MANGTCSIDGCENGGQIRRGWCGLHYQRWQAHGDPLMLSQGRTPEARFWEKVRVFEVANPDACWLWTASQEGGGYGRMSMGERWVMAHRFSYELLVGPIPDGLQLDHLCRVRHCVNPDHLEPVTCRENLLRGDTIYARNAAKTHCPAGHEYTPENTRVYRGRNCRACARARSRADRARKRLSLHAPPDVRVAS